MITCCELALTLGVGAFTVILALLAMFFNYNLKLDARTVKLEKKNGAELAEIQSLKKLCKNLIEEQDSLEKLQQELTTLKKQLHEMSPLSEKKNSV